MRNAQAYVRPRSLDEAVALVRDRPGRAAYLGGGTGLAVVDDPSIDTLVDLGPLGLDAIETTPSGLRIGAMVPLERLRQPPWAALGSGTLAAALGCTRSVAWRNQATLGGRLRDGDPTDLVTTALLVLDAHAVVQMAPGAPAVTMPLASVSGLPPEALITAVEVAATGDWTFALESFQITTLAPPVVAVGVAVRRGHGETLHAARVASCGMTPHPARAVHVEAALGGAAAATLAPAWMRAFDADIRPADDWRASAAYRTHLGRTLLARALRRAIDTRPEATR